MAIETGLRPPLTEIQRRQVLRPELGAGEGCKPPKPVQYPYPEIPNGDDILEKFTTGEHSGHRRPASVPYPYTEIPEGDVYILGQITIGKHPEQIGNKKEVESIIRKMRQLGVDFPYNAGGLTVRECAYIYNFDHGAKTDKKLAERLDTSQGNIRTLRLGLEKKFEGREISFKPDRTYTPMEQQFLDHYERGIGNVADLATALQTSETYIRFLKGSLIKKGEQIEFQRKPHPFKKRLLATTDNMSAA